MLNNQNHAERCAQSTTLVFMDSWRARARAAMKARGLTYKKLAAKVGVSTGSIGHYMTGETTPSVAVLLRMSEALDIPLSELMDDNGLAARDNNERELLRIWRACSKKRQRLLMRVIRSVSSDT